MLIDPHAAISTIQESLALWDSIPSEYKASREDQRTILYDTIKLAEAYTRAREYSSALNAYERAAEQAEHNLKLDPQDTRSQEDLAGILGSQARPYIEMLDPVLYRDGQADRQANTRRAIVLLRRAIALTERLVAEDANNTEWIAYLANNKADLGTLVKLSGDRAEGVRLIRSGLATLCTLASRSDASEDTLYRATSAFLSAPLELRDSRLALQLGERLVVLTQRKDPNSLVLLAQASLYNGQIANAIGTAKEGLKLLPPQDPGTSASRCRILLEHILANKQNRNRTLPAS
jgi:tetratricopeptide (TPR) repeat protein